jgi:large subunit ribosomal protein L17
MASSLFFHKRITTTLAKAKALRTYVEHLLQKQRMIQLIRAELYSAI